MRNWGTQYLTFEVSHGLAGNCVALAKKILWEQYRKTLPSFLALCRMAKQGKDLPLVEVTTLRDGMLVVCGNRVHPARHVGVYSQVADRVVHALPEAGCVRAEPLWRMKLEWPVVTFYKVVRQ